MTNKERLAMLDRLEQQAQWHRNGKCIHCGHNARTKKCRKCGKRSLVMIKGKYI